MPSLVWIGRKKSRRSAPASSAPYVPVLRGRGHGTSSTRVGVTAPTATAAAEQKRSLPALGHGKKKVTSAGHRNHHIFVQDDLLFVHRPTSEILVPISATRQAVRAKKTYRHRPSVAFAAVAPAREAARLPPLGHNNAGGVNSQAVINNQGSFAMTAPAPISPVFSPGTMQRFGAPHQNQDLPVQVGLVAALSVEALATQGPILPPLAAGYDGVQAAVNHQNSFAKAALVSPSFSPPTPTGTQSVVGASSATGTATTDVLRLDAWGRPFGHSQYGLDPLDRPPALGRPTALDRPPALGEFTQTEIEPDAALLQGSDPTTTTQEEDSILDTPMPPLPPTPQPPTCTGDLSTIRYGEKLMPTRAPPPPPSPPHLADCWPSTSLDTKETQWHRSYMELQQFQRTHGHCNVPPKWESNPSLAKWVQTQRRQYFNNLVGLYSKMTDVQMAKLDLLGFEWDIPKTFWSSATS